MTNFSPLTPDNLGMQMAVELVSARQDTFFYRGIHKRIIEHKVVNNARWSTIKGPLLYCVADRNGVIRYVGKWVTSTPLYARWIRHSTIHHHEQSRNLYLEQLDANLGPLSIWSVSIEELLPCLPADIKALPTKEIAMGLEALFVNNWKEQQLHWNDKSIQVPPLFQKHLGKLQMFPVKH